MSPKLFLGDSPPHFVVFAFVFGHSFENRGILRMFLLLPFGHESVDGFAVRFVLLGLDYPLSEFRISQIFLFHNRSTPGLLCHEKVKKG